MCDPLTATDLIPLIAKLPHDEQVRLAKLALRAAATDRDDLAAYLAAPPRSDELSSQDEALAWDAEGWDDFVAARRDPLIRWYVFAPPDKRRPVLLLTRDAVLGLLNEIIVAPVTRTVRGIATEVLLTADDGMPTSCAINLDHVALAQRARLGTVLTELPGARWPEVERALLTACGFRPGEPDA